MGDLPHGNCRADDSPCTSEGPNFLLKGPLQLCDDLQGLYLQRFVLTTQPALGAQILSREQLFKCVQAKDGANMSDGSWGGWGVVRHSRSLLHH